MFDYVGVVNEDNSLTLRSELEGVKPLTVNELDVRAEMLTNYNKYKDTLKFTVNKEVREYLNRTNSSFIKARNDFLEILKESINEDVSTEDIKEMLIQHILTADFFTSIFNSSYFHKENNINL
jgi:predicted helicase